MESKNKDGIINSLGGLCTTSLENLPETIGDKKTYTITEVQLQKLIEKVSDKVYNTLRKEGLSTKALDITNSIKDTITHFVASNSRV